MTLKTVHALIAAALLGVPAQAETLRIGTSADYPPWESVDQDNQIIGFDRDVGDAICDRIDAECEWINQAYDGLLPGLQIGKFDFVISGISITDERAQMVDFSTAYADAPNAFFTISSNEGLAATESEALASALSDKVIGVQIGTTHSAVVAAHFSESTIRNYDRPEQIVDDVIAGRLDAGLMERAALEPFLAGNNERELVQIGQLLASADYAEFGQGQAVASKQGDNELNERVNAAIDEMLADGTLAELSNKWFGYDLSFQGE
ncbi:transporter substrate-binding domain-containing protein [Celeribacter sp.]|uniref:transporter substrate-binding domain-containing protein n=1 Tax=Celeribacter sp. TaxID=1890673 RepID=UPI003A8D96B9